MVASCTHGGTRDEDVCYVLCLLCLCEVYALARPSGVCVWGVVNHSPSSIGWGSWTLAWCDLKFCPNTRCACFTFEYIIVLTKESLSSRRSHNRLVCTEQYRLDVCASICREFNAASWQVIELQARPVVKDMLLIVPFLMSLAGIMQSRYHSADECCVLPFSWAVSLLTISGRYSCESCSILTFRGRTLTSGTC